MVRMNFQPLHYFKRASSEDSGNAKSAEIDNTPCLTECELDLQRCKYTI